MMDDLRYSFDLRNLLCEMMSTNVNARPNIEQVMLYSRDKEKSLREGSGK